MQLRDGRLSVSPSDVSAFLACQHLTTLELASARGEVVRPAVDNAPAELIRRKGDEHELAYLEELRARGLATVEIERDDWKRAAAETEQALARGVEVVYQGVFIDEGWRGVADFLERQANGSYEAADTKLARTSKPSHSLQLCFCTEQLARVTGREPAFMDVLLGSGLRDSYRPGDFMAYYRRLRQRVPRVSSREGVGASDEAAPQARKHAAAPLRTTRRPRRAPASLRAHAHRIDPVIPAWGTCRLRGRAYAGSIRSTHIDRLRPHLRE